VELPDGIEKVDIIISEWMGYCLLYESMLNTVLFARDKWLKPREEGGMMLPSTASIYIAGIEDAEYKDQKIQFWDNVYGFKFTPFKRLALMEPLVESCDSEQVCTNASTVVSFDLHTVKTEDLNFTDRPFTITMRRKDCVHALLCWFDVKFTDGHHRVVIPTGPHDKYTHWKQTVFYLDSIVPGSAGETISGSMSISSNKANFRDLDIRMKVEFHGKAADLQFSQDYRLR